MEKALPSTCCEDRRGEDPPTLREGGSRTAARAHGTVATSPSLQLGCRCASRGGACCAAGPYVSPHGGGGGGGGRVVPDREQPGASAEPRSPPESAHPLPPLAESIPRLCSPHLGRGLWLWLRFSDAETETQGDRAAVRWGPGWGGGVGAPPRPPLLHVGWGQVWNFLLLFTFEWCRRPGGARLGSLSGSSTPSTPGIFIPV